MLDIQKTLELITPIAGVSGNEMKVSGYIKDLFSKTCNTVKEDALGNIIAIKEGSGNKKARRKIMLAAHMDEIGLMVKKIDKKGFVFFTNVGGMDYRTLLSQEVTIHGKKDIFGVIGAKPPHLQKQNEKNKSIKMDELYIDVGLSKEELEKWIDIGDFITINRDLTSLQGEYITGKALDDRGGIAALLECMKELEHINHQLDVYFVATVQEEVGLRGAITSTYGIMPDLGIAIDVGHGRTPGVPKEDTIELDKGPAIGLGPNIHPKINKKLIEIAKKFNIPYQPEVIPGRSGTDAWAMQVTQSGVPTGLLSIPLRYMHTSVEVASKKDIELTGRMLSLFIASLNDINWEEWLCY
ncbi:M42 family metallopeptidase [Irregularibacter muris]|uniref:M42 family metallopeptidase n=1 Tax=Irregularibacter muris TaxID=1796619 RepID=UPI0027D47267|nr:M42 family metallopeptidase [Irregularibacter muris]